MTQYTSQRAREATVGTNSGSVPPSLEGHPIIQTEVEIDWRELHTGSTGHWHRWVWIQYASDYVHACVGTVYGPKMPHGFLIALADYI